MTTYANPLDDPAVDPFRVAADAAAQIAEKTGVERHDIALTLGSGWGSAADLIGETTATIPATEITGFSKPALEGHVGSLRSILLPSGKRALIIGARTHYYEGHGVRRVVHSVRTAAATGATTMILTNGAGGIKDSWTPGTPVLISDHLNLTADSPLEGATFVDLTDLYSARLRAVAREIDPSLDDGVYCQFRGPHYETPAEVQMAKTIGGHIVGMSTALEAIAARQAGMEILGLSLITNLAAGIQKTPLSHEEVIEAGKTPQPGHQRAARENRGGAVSDKTVNNDTASATILDQARAWLAQDPDVETRAELDALIADAEAGSANTNNADAVAELHSRFDSRLEFGTAGLRGELAAGPNRMNRVLVAQAAAGFAAYLLGREKSPSVVIGYDGRKNSQVFATDTAEIMAGAGVRTIILPRLLPTPVLAFAVRHLDVSAGVMVTASHNPPNDNGYKVYLGGSDHGSQIVSPADAEIEAQIQQVAASRSVSELPRSNDYATADESVLDEYVRLTAGLAPRPEASLNFVYTAMHGVGWETARRVFADAGFGEPVVVAEQIQPDPAFPTVAFPNPEEPGALDLSYATATAASAELIIANDPDADRLAVAVPTTAAGSSTGWRRLSGNEIGSMLGWKAAERLQAERVAVAALGGDTAVNKAGTLAASIVSSPALAEIARQYELDYVDTLTGFKWVSRVPGLSYGYEEALGYLVDPQKVRDKDGISAAVGFLSLVAELKAQGKTIEDHELAFAEKFGAFASGQVSVRVTDLSDIPRIMSGLRANPPTQIGGVAVRQIDDFADGFADFPASDILRIWLEDGSRVIVRPSGTEPKVKVYLDASSAQGTAAERIHAAQAAVDALDAAVRPLLS